MMGDLDHRGINENSDNSEATADVAAPTNGVISRRDVQRLE